MLNCRQAIEEAIHVLSIKRDSELAKAVDVSVALTWLEYALKILQNPPPSPPGGLTD
jgi:hypothetical protein